MSEAVISSKADRIDRFCFWAILIDILFLPYFTFISTSMSLPIIVCWFLVRGKNTHFCKEYKYFPIVVLLMIVATLISILYSFPTLYETSLSTSIKRLLQFISSFWYFFFFQYYFTKYRPNIFRILFCGILYIAALAVLYHLFRNQYMVVKLALNPADNHTRRALANEVVYRYNFLWTDPNNVAYAAIGMTMYLWVGTKKFLKEKLISLAACAFVVLSTMSNGGIIIGVFCAFLLWVSGIRWGKKRSNSFWLRFVIVSFIVLLATIAVYSSISRIFATDLIAKILERFTSYTSSGDFSGGRLGDLFNSFKMLNPMFVILGSGKEGFSTENGHIYLFAMYGLPVYTYFMYVLFGKKKMALKKYLVFLPFFVGFTMNIAIIEQKFLLLLLLFAAICAADRQTTESESCEQGLKP